MRDAHWKAWFDQAIPALGGRTPRQAATTAEGRELLESLLGSYEWRSASGAGEAPELAPDVAALRAELGM